MKLLLSNAAVSLGHQYQLVSRDIVFLDCLRNHSLGIAVGVNVGCIPLPASIQLRIQRTRQKNERY